MNLFREASSKAFLHFLVEGFAGLDVGEVGQIIFEDFDDVGFADLGLGKGGAQGAEDRVDLGQLSARRILDHTQVGEGRGVQCFARHKKLFEGLLRWCRK